MVAVAFYAHANGKQSCFWRIAILRLIPVVDRTTTQIITTTFRYGSKVRHLCILADTGYQGLAVFHENCQTPFKKSKLYVLMKREKPRNRTLTRKRIVIEYIFRKLKVFRVQSERYLNSRKGLRAST